MRKIANLNQARRILIFSIRVKRQHSDYNYDYDGYDDYEEPEQEPLDINELFQMELPEKAKSRIELRLKKHFCKKFASQGSGEPCQFSKECRCGEFCSNEGVCKPAECHTHNQGICQTYPGFNSK